jgi:hypothetical protein
VKYLFIYFVLFSFSYPIEEKLKSISYLRTDYEFSSSSDITIKDGKIIKIEPSSSKIIQSYVLPSFCDVYVTLGGNKKLTPELSIEAYNRFGFTHIHSVADGDKLLKIQSSTLSISNSLKPVLIYSKEYDSLNLQNYTLLRSFEDLNNLPQSNYKFLEIFLRHNEDNSIYLNSKILNDLREKSYNLRIHTFADSISILDTLISGNRNIIHPIPVSMEKELTRNHFKEIIYTPILNVYKNFQYSIEENDLELLNKSSFFKTHFSELYKEDLENIDTENLYLKKKEFEEYLQFIQRNPELIHRIFLGSGSGHKLSYPGISAIQELILIKNIFPKSKYIFKILTENSCSLLSNSYRGKIELNGEANLIFLKLNPYEKVETLLNIEKLYYKGKSIFIPKKK